MGSAQYAHPFFAFERTTKAAHSQRPETHTGCARLAVVHLGDQTLIGLALAARPADGSFDTDVSDPNALANWVAASIP